MEGVILNMSGILVVAALIGLIPAIIANKKGHSFFVWWLFGSGVFILALPLSIILKPNKEELERRLGEEGLIKCPFCAEMVKEEAMVCKFCKSSLKTKEELELYKENKAKEAVMNLSQKDSARLRKNWTIKVDAKDGLWMCPSCFERNKELQSVCWKCGQEIEK